MFLSKRILKLFGTPKLKKLESDYLSSNSPYSLYKYIRELIRENKNSEAMQLMNQKQYELNNSKIPSQYIDKINGFKQLLKKRGVTVQERYENINKKNPSSFFRRLRYFTYFMFALYMYMSYNDYKIQIKFSNQLPTIAKKTPPEHKTLFSDIHGIDQFKDQLLQIVDYLKDPEKYRKVGAKLPRGILLIGNPGTGKTMMARALANEAGCAFLYKNGADFNQIFVGNGARKVRKLFKDARQQAPAIIFIDQIDSVAGNRQNQKGSNDTLNQILVQMDGFRGTENIIVIGATNFQKSIDPAIKRAGRFDKTIHVPLPDIGGRTNIFKHYLKKIKYHEVTPQTLAKRTIGFSGADIQNMVNQAILNAVKQKRNVAEPVDFQYAFDRIVMGVGRKNMFISEKDKLITAYHQSGHTLVSLLTKGSTPLHKVTLLPRGGALGFTAFIPDDDMNSMNKMQYLASIDVAFGGKIAQQIFLGNGSVTSGSSNDLKQATNIANSYVKMLGMEQNISLINQQGVKVSQKYLYELDKQVQKILHNSYGRVKNLLITHKDQLSLLAKHLLQKQTLTAQQVRNILKIPAEKK